MTEDLKYAGKTILELNAMILDYQRRMRVKALCHKYGIGKYTLYRILERFGIEPHQTKAKARRARLPE